MTIELALRQKLRAAEESAEYWKRRAEHAQAQLHMATLRMQQAEDTMRGVVGDLCECIGCSRRRAL